MKKQGLVIIHTGNGKGKTTAALGLGLRAWGQGLRVLVLQFIKGSWKYGELKAAAALGDRFVIRQLGGGFVSGEKAKDGDHLMLAQEALAAARTELHSGNWDMLILDEINYAISFGIVALDDVLQLLSEKPPSLHLVLTGRNATPAILAVADLVTEMTEIKHPHKKGIAAQAGIEF